MANYYATTVSEGGEIIEGAEKKVQAIIDEYTFGDLTVLLNNNAIEMYGEDYNQAYPKGKEDSDNEVEEFLQKLSPYLKTPFIVSEVGNEKCRYVQAYAYVLKPKGDLKCASLENAILKLLK